MIYIYLFFSLNSKTCVIREEQTSINVSWTSRHHEWRLLVVHAYLNREISWLLSRSFWLSVAIEFNISITMKFILTLCLCLLVVCFAFRRAEANAAIGRTDHDDDPNADDAFSDSSDEDVDSLVQQFENMRLINQAQQEQRDQYHTRKWSMAKKWPEEWGDNVFSAKWSWVN